MCWTREDHRVFEVLSQTCHLVYEFIWINYLCLLLVLVFGELFLEKIIFTPLSEGPLADCSDYDWGGGGFFVWLVGGSLLGKVPEIIYCLCSPSLNLQL